MFRVKISDIDCYYELYGKGDPLILISGLASDSQSWQPVLGSLAKKFKVIVFDNRGIGRTRYPPENFLISTLAFDTVCLLDKLKIERANILGHSMGGCIAQEIAIEYPERVNKLILANTCASLSPKNKSFFESLFKTLESGNYELYIREFFSLIFSAGYLSNKETVESAVKAALNYPFHVTPEGFRLQLKALSNFNSKDRLKRIKAKTLIIVGEKDGLVTAEEAQLLADNIFFCEFLFLKNAAHSLQIEQPRLFIDCIIKSLSLG